jgi:hypothetical protein
MIFQISLLKCICNSIEQHKLETGGSDAEEDEDDVKFDSDEELEAVEPAAKLEPAVKEFATPTSLTTVTVIQDLELDDSYQSSTSNKRKAEDDAAEEEDKGEESKTIPSKVRENIWNAENQPMQKLMSHVFIRAKRNMLRKT